MNLCNFLKNSLLVCTVLITANSYADGEDPLIFNDNLTEKYITTALALSHNKAHQKEFLVKLPTVVHEEMLQQISLDEPFFAFNHTISVLDNLIEYFNQYNS